MNRKRCVLAYSGGLDTSAIVIWLCEQGYEVHAVLVDVGQNEDLIAARDKALRYGAATAVVRDAKPAMFKGVLGRAIGLASAYEGQYRLGTALARPFIAAEQVLRARELGGATLVHGATGKGNDQVRFEFAYRSLAPDLPVLAPWKVWEFRGRHDLVAYLRGMGFDDDYEVVKEFSLDENLWHLSIEGGDLEDPAADLDVEAILAKMAPRFAQAEDDAGSASRGTVELTFDAGRPVALNGEPTPLPLIVATLNRRYRTEPWAWDLVIENRFTGIKSRGIYLNPAAVLLQTAADALARSCFHKPLYDRYTALGRDYAELLYRGEYFSVQRQMLDQAADALLTELSGEVRLCLQPALHVGRIHAPSAILRRELATFEASDFDHADAAGFIHLSYLSNIGQPLRKERHEDALEAAGSSAPNLRKDEPLPGRRLVPPTV